MRRLAWRCVVLATIGVTAAACSSNNGGLEPPRGMTCVDDSQTCIAERSIALNQLMNDKSRSWVSQPPPAVAYASGVRLFAFKQRKRELNCDELAVGRREADAAPTTLRGPQGAGLTPAQISRGVMFAAEVGRELGNEAKRRCKA